MFSILIHLIYLRLKQKVVFANRLYPNRLGTPEGPLLVRAYNQHQQQYQGKGIFLILTRSGSCPRRGIKYGSNNPGKNLLITNSSFVSLRACITFKFAIRSHSSINYSTGISPNIFCCSLYPHDNCPIF